MASLAGGLSFAVLGMFLSLAPTIVGARLRVHSPLTGALLAFAMPSASATAQLSFRRWAPTTQMRAGLLLPLGTAAFIFFAADGALFPILAACYGGASIPVIALGLAGNLVGIVVAAKGYAVLVATGAALLLWRARLSGSFGASKRAPEPGPRQGRLERLRRGCRARTRRTG